MVSNHISVGIAISCLNWNVRSQGAGYKTMKFAVGFHYFRSTNPKKIGPLSIVSIGQHGVLFNGCWTGSHKKQVFDYQLQGICFLAFHQATWWWLNVIQNSKTKSYSPETNPNSGKQLSNANATFKWVAFSQLSRDQICIPNLETASPLEKHGWFVSASISVIFQVSNLPSPEQ